MVKIFKKSIKILSKPNIFSFDAVNEHRNRKGKRRRFIENFILPISICTALTLTSCATSQTTSPQKQDDFDLASSILDSQAFAKAPLPRVKNLHYQALDSSGQASSDLIINLMQTKNRITKYQTEESSPNKKVEGISIACGGLAPFTVERQTTILNQPKQNPSISKFKILKIDQISGNLFPLKVGNSLSFHFVAMHQTDNQPEHVYDGLATYNVVSVKDNLILNGQNVPGETYKIQYSEAVGQSPLQIHAEYLFSPRLGWFVQASLFKSGALSKNYQLVDAKNSLAFMKPPSQ